MRKLNVPDKCRAARKALPLLPMIGGLIFAAGAMPEGTVAQQTQTDSASSASRSPQRELTEEWVYRVQDGHKDEWFRVFKKYQLAILSAKGSWDT